MQPKLRRGCKCHHLNESAIAPEFLVLPKTVGCSDADIYTDKASGVRGNRPGLDACVEALVPGDTLVVWRLDRLGRSMPHLVGLVEDLLGKGIGFRSLSDGAIDTTTASGELMFNIFSSLARKHQKVWGNCGAARVMA